LASGGHARSERLTYESRGEGRSFSTAPLERDMELAGPVKATLWVSSSTTDMDIFATLRAYAPDGKEATFFSAVEPRSPVSQGWLRVSHRKLDAARSRPWFPYHAHDEAQPLRPGQVVKVEVEIWPMSLALPRGSRLELLVQGRDFERSGFFQHEDARDRPPEVFGGTNAIHVGGDTPASLLLPVLA